MIKANQEVLQYKLNNYRRHIIFALILFISVGFPHIINGQEKLEIKEVIIEAKQKQTSLIREKEAIEDLVILSRSEIRHVGSKGAGEVLRRLPGIMVQGPPMAYRNAKINGLDKEYQSILIDGHRPAGGEDRREFKLDRLPASLIEGVEVVYNPVVIYGGSAPAGIINLVTIDVPRSKEFGLDLGLDHSNTHSGVHPEGSIYYGNRHKTFGYFFYAGRSQYKRNDKSILSDSESGVKGTKDELSTVSLNTGLARFVFQANDSNALNFKMLWSDQKQREDLSADAKLRTQGGLSYRRDSSLELANLSLMMTELSHDFTNNSLKGSTRVVYDWSWMDKQKNREQEKDPQWESSKESESQQLHLLSVKSDWSLESLGLKSVVQTLKTGVAGSYNWRDFDRMAFVKISDHRFWDEVEDGSYKLVENSYAWYLLDELKIKDHLISSGIRIENHDRIYSTADTSGMANYWRFLPSIHGKHTFSSEKLTLRWGLSRQNVLQPFLYMVPVLKVKHKKEIIEKGNPDLLPGKSWNYHLKVQRSISNGSWIAVRGLYTDIRDVVEMKYLGIDEKFSYRTFQPMNIDSARIFSSSLEFTLDMHDFSNSRMKFWGNLSWNSSKVRDPGTFLIRQLNDQPTWQTSLNADYLLPDINTRFSLGYTWIGKRMTANTVGPGGAAIPGFYYDPFSQFDCSVKYYFSRWGYFSLSLHNLFGAREVLHQGTVLDETHPGRLYRFGLSLSF